jgi:endoglucanase
MASGGNDLSHIDTSPPQEAYILYGAVVGGPDDKDRFYDIRSDWPETEVPALYFISKLSAEQPNQTKPSYV